MGRKTPRITANTVTLLRLLPMPLLCWLIYQQHYWTALILGTLVGCTDFIDGYLARKHGPTVLGGLMDPIADKVFIALVYLPFADPRGSALFAAWAVALMFVREFFVTALRSAYERRHLEMKTTYLAKTKTWVQMQAIGLAMLFVLLAPHPAVMRGILIGMVALPMVATAALWLFRRRFWPGAIVMGAATLPLIFVHQYATLEVTLGVLLTAIVAITWLSGFDYIRLGIAQLRGHRLDEADTIRLIGAVALPCLLFAVLALTPAWSWPLAAILALELAIGGLDNLLSHHRVGASATAWGIRVLGTSALLAAAMILGLFSANSSLVNTIVVAALCVTILGISREFWRGRDYYIDSRLRKQHRHPSTKDPDTSDHHVCTPEGQTGKIDPYPTTRLRP